MFLAIVLGIILAPVIIWAIGHAAIYALAAFGWSFEAFTRFIDWPERYLRKTFPRLFSDGFQKNPSE